jgi:hypothetical protein
MRTMWLWLSMIPGTTVRPCRFTTCVPAPCWAPAPFPTITKRPFLMATSDTTVLWSSMVWILPFQRMRSGPLGANGGSAVTRRADVAIHPATPPKAAAMPAPAPALRRVRRDTPFLPARGAGLSVSWPLRGFPFIVPLLSVLRLELRLPHGAAPALHVLQVASAATALRSRRPSPRRDGVDDDVAVSFQGPSPRPRHPERADLDDALTDRIPARRWVRTALVRLRTGWPGSHRLHVRPCHRAHDASRRLNWEVGAFLPSQMTRNIPRGSPGVKAKINVR